MVPRFNILYDSQVVVGIYFIVIHTIERKCKLIRERREEKKNLKFIMFYGGNKFLVLDENIYVFDI